MNDLERRRTDMLLRVNNFGVENNNEVKNNLKAVAAFAKVQAVVTELEATGALRTSAAETKFAFSDRRSTLREELYSQLSDISRTARQIARDDEMFLNKFKTPQNNRNDAVLLETARAFAADLASVEQAFLEYGMPAGFIAELTADTDGFEQSISNQDSKNRERIEANASIDDMLSEALVAVRTLKVIIPNLYRNNAGKLADWASASHVEKAPKPRQPITPNG